MITKVLVFMNRYFLKNLVLVLALIGSPLFLQANALHDAISYKDFTKVRRWVFEQPNLINEVDRHGATPLLLAVRSNQAYLVMFLLEFGACVDAVDNHGNTALHHAAEGLFYDVASFLLYYGASVNIRNGKKITPLHLAARPLPSAPIKKQLAMIAQDQYGCTPLRYAIRGWAYESGKNGINKAGRRVAATSNIFFNAAGKELIRLGADVTVRDVNKYTLLHTAAFHGNIEAVTMLLSFPNIDLRALSYENKTACQSALASRHRDIAELIRQAEAMEQLSKSVAGFCLEELC
jgi:ankyrin repeat protein